MTKEREALKALIHEMEYVLSCINAEEIPFDGDDFHEALRLGKEALDHLAQPEQEKERCVGCEACIDTACGRDECPKGWPKAAQPEQEPVAWRWLSSKTWKQWSLSDDKKLVAEAVEWLGEEKVQPLYTTPPQRTWVGLTEDEAFACKWRDYFETYKAIEAKLKEKNGG